MSISSVRFEHTMVTCGLCDRETHGYFEITVADIDMKICKDCHNFIAKKRDLMSKVDFTFTVNFTVSAINLNDALVRFKKEMNKNNLKWELVQLPIKDKDNDS